MDPKFPFPRLYIASAIVVKYEGEMADIQSLAVVETAPTDQIAEVKVREHIRKTYPDPWKIEDVQLGTMSYIEIADYIGELRDAYALYAL